jgi:hypothetical protein
MLAPEDNNTLLGIIVGGALGFLIVGVGVGALISFCMTRNRRQPKDTNANALHALQLQSENANAVPESNYGRIAPQQSDSDRDVPYDRLNTNEV